MTIARPMRADAVRNRRNILDAATAQISEHGPDVGMDEIAASAGVAVGTLYRHFPTKTDLLAAVIAEYVSEVADDAEACLARAREGARPGDEVVGFLRRVTESVATAHAVKSAARGLGVVGHGDQSDEARAVHAMQTLLDLAHAAGQIRPEVTVQDVYLLMETAPADQPPETRRRWFELMLPGITAAPR